MIEPLDEGLAYVEHLWDLSNGGFTLLISFDHSHSQVQGVWLYGLSLIAIRSRVQSQTAIISYLYSAIGVIPTLDRLLHVVPTTTFFNY
jgi:hypothetical protein